MHPDEAKPDGQGELNQQTSWASLKRIQELHSNFFDEDSRAEKDKLRRELDGLEWSFMEATLRESGREAALAELKRASATHRKPFFLWRLHFGEVFQKRGGFDVVIANPPYISALEFSSKFSESYRKQLNAQFATAKGSYDIYVLFMELGLRLLVKEGALVFINPNKYLSASYAVALREYIIANAALAKIVDVSGIEVFETAAVYPIVSVLQKVVPDSYNVNLVMPRVRKAQEFNISNYSEAFLSSDLLRCLPENIWGFLLSSKIKLLLKLLTKTQKLSDVAAINASSTAAEADDYGSHIENQKSKNALKLVNTGTIEPYFSFWGIETLTHAGKKYLTPYLPLDRAGVNERRRQLYSAPKLIFAKMAKSCEVFFDRHGEFASLNTNCLYSPKDDLSLGFLAGYCNSKIFMFFYEQFFGALRMSGGYYQFQAPQIRVIPIRKPDKKTEKSVEVLVERILAAKAKDAAADVSALEQEIDELVYALYALTPEEIQIVKGTAKAN